MGLALCFALDQWSQTSVLKVHQQVKFLELSLDFNQATDLDFKGPVLDERNPGN